MENIGNHENDEIVSYYCDFEKNRIEPKNVYDNESLVKELKDFGHYENNEDIIKFDVLNG